MSLTHNPGRVAGFLYLLLLGAPLRLIYIPSVLFVSGNATATASNIAASQTPRSPGETRPPEGSAGGRRP